MKRTIVFGLALAALLLAPADGVLAKKKKDKTKAEQAQNAARSGKREAGEPRKTSELPKLWSDPRFQEEFLGSFRTNSEIEPMVTSVERERMEEDVLPLLQTDVEAAREALEKLATPGASAVFDFTLANLYFQEERLDEAAERYEIALDKFPAFRRAHKNLGLIHVRTGRFGEAITSLSRVIQLGGDEGLVYGLLGYAYSSTEQYVPAESAYRQALLLQPDVLDWKLGLTQSVLRQRKYGEAVTLCDELVARYPERSDYWLLQANSYIGLGQPMDATRNFEIVRRMGKATVGSMKKLGDIYVNQDMPALATKAYLHALELDPAQNVAPMLDRVNALAQRGGLDQAELLLDRLDEMSRDRLDGEQRKQVLKLRSRIALAEGQSDEEAVGVLEEIVTLDPLDGEALLLLGQHYARIDEPDRAIFYFERAGSIDEFEADAKVRHAQVLVAMSKYREALPLLKRAQEISPRDNVARYLEQVERLSRGRR